MILSHGPVSEAFSVALIVLPLRSGITVVVVVPDVDEMGLSTLMRDGLWDVRSTTADCAWVAILGGAGGIGQPLSLLMKLNPLVKELRVYDVVKHTPGVAAGCFVVCLRVFSRFSLSPSSLNL